MSALVWSASSGPEGSGEPASSPVAVAGARAVVTGADEGEIRRLVTLVDGLSEVAPGVAVAQREPDVVRHEIRAVGAITEGESAVAADPDQPALEAAAEEAVRPRAVRSLLERAVTEGRQVRVTYYTSSRGGAGTDRVVCPWRYADNLLTGYCHLRQGERTFAADRIARVRLLIERRDHEPG